MVTMAPAATPGCRLAPFRKTTLAGPGGLTVRLKVIERPPMRAVITTAPAVPPAVTVVEALPLTSVEALAVVTVALPLVTEKVTDAFCTGWPLESVTLTTSGLAKGVFTTVAWLLPETMVMPATDAGGVFMVTANVALIKLLPDPAVTCTCAWPGVLPNVA